MQKHRDTGARARKDAAKASKSVSGKGAVNGIDSKSVAADAVKTALADKGGKGKTKRVAKEVGKQQALVAATKAAESKGVPLVGFDEVLRNPKSVKAWAVAGTRSAIAAGLTFVAGTAGVYIEKIIHRFGYKKLAIMAAISMTLQIITAVMFLMLAASVASETIAKPLGIVSSIMKFIPGLGDDESKNEMETAPGNICKAQPEPRARYVSEHEHMESTTEDSPLPPIEGAPDSTETTETETPSSGGYTPPSAFNEDGSVTADAKELMRKIPNGSDALLAETWLLYALSHQSDDQYYKWEDFRPMYATAYHYVEDKKKTHDQQQSTSPKQKGESLPKLKKVDLADETPTPMEIAMNIDQGTYYEPFSLAAATMTASLIMEDDGYLTVTSPSEESAVIGRVQTLCGI